jgi:DUF2075 family protein
MAGDLVKGQKVKYTAANWLAVIDCMSCHDQIGKVKRISKHGEK